MSHEKGWPFHVLLNDVLILRSFDLPTVESIFLLLCLWEGVLLSCFYTLFNFQILIHFLSCIFLLSVQLKTQLFYFLADENTSTLRSALRFTNVNYYRVFFRLRFCHLSIRDFLFTLFFFVLRIFLNVVKFRRVHPGFWKELEMIRKIFLKPL